LVNFNHTILFLMSKEKNNQDYSNISTEGSFFSIDENGISCMNLDKRVTPVAMGEIYKYLYQDRV
jgi:hypothetical protein